MSARAKWYMQEEVARLLENWARWPGWASGAGSRSTLAWLDDFVANKRVGEMGATIPIMAGEAADTHHALGRIAIELSEALVMQYTWRGTAAEKLHDRNRRRVARERISRRTFFYRVAAAHFAFVEQYRAVRQEANIVGVANDSASVHAGKSVARRHRFVISPKMGLVTQKNTSENNG